MAKKKRRAPPSSEAAHPGSHVPRPYLFAGAAAVVSVIAAITVGVVVLFGGGDDDGGSNTGQRTAVIVDQLELTYPGPQFISDARSTLSKAGYSVDYIGGEQVGVETYKSLASRDYDLVILRVHAGITTEVDAETGEKTNEEYVSLFTNEKYDQGKYSEDQLNRLGKATYPGGTETFFGIGPEFVKSIPGDFDGAPIILMGCDGLRSQRTAEAFQDKGAGPFVSWTDQVSGNFTDTATLALLKHWLTDGMTLESAVETTASEVGPDPTYKGELRILAG